MILKNKVVIILGFFILLVIGFVKSDSFQDYNLSVIVSNHQFKDKQNIELLKGSKIDDEFVANNNKLGIIAIKFNTHQRINDDYLLFKIKEKGSADWYYSNKYKVDQFQNNQYFPFGFPEINNSNGKTYQIEVYSLNGFVGNSVRLIAQNAPFLSKYSFSKTYLLQNKNEIPKFILSKVRSFFTNIGLKNYFLVLFVLFIFVFILRLINFNKLFVYLKKPFKVSTKNDDAFWRKVNKNKWIKFFLLLVCIIVLFIINWKVNSQIKLKTLVLDDFNEWVFFDSNRNDFLAYVLGTEANKFRPVLRTVFFSLFSLFGTNIKLFGVFNLLFSFFIATVLFCIFCKLSKSIIVSLCFSIVFIVSRFAYYNIGQMWGIMEAMALLFASLQMYFVWKYFETSKIKYFWISLILFILLIFTHERFITLLGLYFALFWILGFKGKNVVLLIISSLPVIFNFILKIFVLQIRAFDGTGRTSILQTFDIFNFVKFFFSGCLYLLGINAGPEYLNGIPKESVSININILIFTGIICLLFILVLFGLFVIKANKIKMHIYVSNFVLFLSFIIFSLLAASVTIRLEMRWLYVPLVGLLFLLAYIVGLFVRKYVLVKIVFITVIIWTVILTSVELYYRGYYKNIYFWKYQTFANSLYEATLEKYGDNFWNYKTYIVCPEKSSSFIMSCSDYGDINLLFKQFKIGNNVNNITLIGNVDKDNLKEKDKTLLLKYEQDQGVFVDR